MSGIQVDALNEQRKSFVRTTIGKYTEKTFFSMLDVDKSAVLNWLNNGHDLADEQYLKISETFGSPAKGVSDFASLPGTSKRGEVLMTRSAASVIAPGETHPDAPVKKGEEAVTVEELEAVDGMLPIPGAGIAPEPVKVVTVPVKKAGKQAKVAAPERNICILMPVYKSLDPNTVATMLKFWDQSRMRFEMRAGDAMIARSRNHLATRFLKTDCEWSFWIDDDVILPCGSPGLFRFLTGCYDPINGANEQHWSFKIPDNFLNFIAPDRLISHGKTIVSGIYFDRWQKNTITAVFGEGPKTSLPADQLHPVDFTGFGCIAVHRSVYEDIVKTFPEVMKKDAPGNESGFFTPIQGEDGRMWGEDQSFCWRAKQSGHTTFMDLAVICGHIGSICCGLPAV